MGYISEAGFLECFRPRAWPNSCAATTNRLKPRTAERKMQSDKHLCSSFSLDVKCLWDSVQHPSPLLSSARRRQSACHLRRPTLARKHEPTCLWVHRKDTSHHVLHDIIQAKHEIETTEKTIFCHATRKLQAPIHLI